MADLTSTRTDKWAWDGGQSPNFGPHIGDTEHGSCAINRLYPELLAEIFWECLPTLRELDRYGAFWWPSAALKPARGLVRLTHVCRFWREVALGAAFLWTGINGSASRVVGARSTCADIFLERAKTAPLKIYVNTSIATKVLTVCHNESSRVRELHLLDFDEEDEVKRLCTNFPAPDLEYLTIHTDIFDSELPRDVPSPTVSLFHGYTPNLRWLTLQTQRWLPSNHLPNLTHFIISPRGDRRYVSFWRMSDFIGFLSGCPALQELVLVEPRIVFTEEEENGAALPYLRRVVLGGMSPELTTYFLTHITTSNNVLWRIYSMYCTHRAVCPYLRLPDSSGIITRISLSITSGTQICVTAVGPSSGIRIETARYPSFRECEECRAWLTHLWYGGQLANVQELWLTDYIDHEYLGGYEKILDALPCLTTIVFVEARVRKRSLTDWLQPLLDTLLTCAVGSRGRDLRCPSLSVLHFYLYAAAETNDLETLVQFKGERALLGYPVQSLIIQYVPRRKGEEPLRPLTHLHDDIEYRSSSNPPGIEVPADSTTDLHHYWPDWSLATTDTDILLPRYR